jgi:hypothetical protein
MASFLRLPMTSAKGSWSQQVRGARFWSPICSVTLLEQRLPVNDDLIYAASGVNDVTPVTQHINRSEGRALGGKSHIICS